MTTDRDMLVRHLINVWGNTVKVDDMPDELVIPFALQALQQAAAELSALRARVEELEAVVRKAAAHVIATHNGITPYQTDEEMVNELGAAALDKAGTK